MERYNKDRLQKLAGLICENQDNSKINKLINDKKFLEEFIENAEYSYEVSGDFELVYDAYEDKLDDKTIEDLLNYCDKNNLIDY